MKEYELRDAWYGLVAICNGSPGMVALDPNVILWAAEKMKRYEQALFCSADNCSEFGYIHDGDCSNCPQGTIRARAGLAAPTVRGVSVADSDTLQDTDKK